MGKILIHTEHFQIQGVRKIFVKIGYFLRSNRKTFHVFLKSQTNVINGSKNVISIFNCTFNKTIVQKGMLFQTAD